MKKLIKQIIAVICRISPTLSSRVFYLLSMKRILRLKNPVLFSEKLMKLKLDTCLNNPTVWQCVDKLMVRSYLSDRGISEQNMPKIIGSYSDASDIEFESLPDKFALKCTHGAGFNIICTDKSKLDTEAAAKQLNTWLKTTFGLSSAETHYGKVPPRIICEEFIDNDGGKLPNDYKVYCFDGVPRFVLVCTDRKNGLAKANIMDLTWKDTGYIKPTYASEERIDRPESLLEMLDMAKRVSSEFPFVRVDFYENKGTPILGEMTFTPHACVNSDMTYEGQVHLGRLINITRGK